MTITSTQGPPQHVDLEQMFRSSNSVYVLRVRGDSFVGQHLCDGDYLVIEHRKEARKGERVVALVDGAPVLRRFDGGEIQGVVIGMIRGNRER